MSLHRGSLAEINRLLIENPALRAAWVSEKQTACRGKLQKIIDNAQLTPDAVLGQVNAVLVRTQHPGIKLSPPFFKDETAGIKLQNRRIALNALSVKTDMKSLAICATDGLTRYHPDGFDLIITMLANNPALENVSLILHHSEIDPDKIATLSEALRGKHLSRLSLDKNPITDEGVFALSECFSTTEIDTLVLSDCDIGDAGLRLITNELKNTGGEPRLRSLVLDYNHITLDGLMHFVQMLPLLNIEEVDLMDNHIDAESANAFLKITISEMNGELKNINGKPVEIII